MGDHAELYRQMEGTLYESRRLGCRDVETSLIDGMGWCWDRMSDEDRLKADERTYLRSLPVVRQWAYHVGYLAAWILGYVLAGWDALLVKIPGWPRCSWKDPADVQCSRRWLHLGYHVALTPSRPSRRTPWAS